MVSIDNFSGMFGNIGGMTSLISKIAIGGLIFVIFAGCFGAILYYIYMRRTFKNQIIVFGNAGGNPTKKWTDRGRLIPIGKAGDKLMYLKKNKRHLPPPTIQMGKNEWWYWEKEDGELINIGLEDIDERMRKMGAKFTHTEMRMSRLGIEKNLNYRLQKGNFWEKYGQTVINLVFYVLVTIMLVVLFVQWRKAGAELTSMGSSLKEMAQSVSGSHAPTDKEVGGSGTIPAMIFLVGTGIKNLWRKKS